MNEKVIKSYKGFDKDMKCRDFQYEVGKEYDMDGEIKCWSNSSHKECFQNDWLKKNKIK